jgi:hypothetical protein
MKHSRKKIKLNRETLLQLENGSLRQVAAADWSPRSPPGGYCCTGSCSTCAACTTG